LSYLPLRPTSLRKFWEVQGLAKTGVVECGEEVEKERRKSSCDYTSPNRKQNSSPPKINETAITSTHPSLSISARDSPKQTMRKREGKRGG
jgi:hypothetical protein